MFVLPAAFDCSSIVKMVAVFVQPALDLALAIPITVAMAFGPNTLWF